MERFARVGLKVVIERNLSFAYQLYLSVFIFRPDPQRIQYADGRLVIEHILPIVGEFFMNMAQPRRNTIDLQTDASPALNQSKTGISFMASVQFPTNPKKKTLLSELTLTIYPGHDPSVEPISLLVRDTHQLSAVLAECKRLKQLSGLLNTSLSL